MNPPLGVLLHAVGGLGGGSMYAPLRAIERWSWETYWLIANLFSCVVVPLFIAFCTIPRFIDVMADTDRSVVLTVFVLGVLWGVGALMFGLAMRWLGMSLGMALVLGMCTVLGTLIPPLLKGTMGELISNLSNIVALTGLPICVVGIALCGYAGVLKERELTAEQKSEGVKEFHLIKGFLAALISGTMGAFSNIGIEHGGPIAQTALSYGASDIFVNNAVIVPLAVGNFLTCLVICLGWHWVNRSWGDYVRGPAGRLTLYYFLASLAGVIGAQEFFWYGMGRTKMGHYDFVSWPIHLAFVLLCSTLWGLYYGEWNGIRRRTWCYVIGGMLVLFLSAVVSGPVAYVVPTIPLSEVLSSLRALTVR